MIIILYYFLEISLSFFTDIDKSMFEENWNYSFLYVIFLTIISLDIYFAFIFDRMKRRAVYENPANYLRRARSEVQFFSARKTALHVFSFCFFPFSSPFETNPPWRREPNGEPPVQRSEIFWGGWNNEGSFSIDGCISEKTPFFLSFFLSWWEIISWNRAGSLGYRWKFETFFFSFFAYRTENMDAYIVIKKGGKIYDYLYDPQFHYAIDRWIGWSARIKFCSLGFSCLPIFHLQIFMLQSIERLSSL